MGRGGGGGAGQEVLRLYIRSPVTAPPSEGPAGPGERSRLHRSGLDYGHVTQEVTISMLASRSRHFRDYSEPQLSADRKTNLMGLHNPVILNDGRLLIGRRGRCSACSSDYPSASYGWNNCLKFSFLRGKKTGSGCVREVELPLARERVFVVNQR